MDHIDPEKVFVSSKSKPRSKAGRATILTPEMLEKLIENYKFRICVTKREVNNRSRADVVSKSIFVLQTLWFVMQCIARCRAHSLNSQKIESDSLNYVHKQIFYA